MQKYSVWFWSLPEHVQETVQTTYGAFLASNLKDKQVGLTSDPTLNALMSQYVDGYDILYTLAHHAGHPLLHKNPMLEDEPEQAADCPLALYCTKWQHFLQHAIVTSHHYSERFFLQCFIGKMHIKVHDVLGKELKSKICDYQINRRLPMSYAPDNLLQVLTAIADYRRCRGMITQSPHDYGASTRPITGNLIQPVHALTNEEVIEQIIARLSAPAQRACYLCGSTDQLVPGCPRIQLLRDNPAALASMLCHLPAAPAACAARSQVAAVTTDTAAEPSQTTDVDLLDLSDDLSPAPVSDGAVSDFQ
jgi:hypothetical protein